jgi:hypothetical protein
MTFWASKETTNNTEHLNKNENFIEIFEMLFIFNFPDHIIDAALSLPLLLEPA